MRDFTLDTYRSLVKALQSAQYIVFTLKNFLTNPNHPPKSVIIRHDVDKYPQRALLMARLEVELNLTTSYYFRCRKGRFDSGIIQRIAAEGHEIGYHYEDLSTARGNKKEAIRTFRENLEKLRALTPVDTICMHGKPLSKWDNRDLWEGHDYRDFGIMGEPYYDIDYNKVLYLTDTGRRWDGVKVNLRDQVKSAFHSNYRSTLQIIRALQENQLPTQLFFNIHPQRWCNRLPAWLAEFAGQNLKNAVKFLFSTRYQE